MRFIGTIVLIVGFCFFAELRTWWLHPGRMQGFFIGARIMPVVDRWIIVSLAVLDLAVMAGVVWWVFVRPAHRGRRGQN